MIAEVDLTLDDRRSERLWTDIDALLTGAGLAVADVGLFAVCVGPGGFTGLRVGMAAIKGFAAAADKGVIGVTSLEAAAFAAPPAPLVLAMVNAYKAEVYSQLFSVQADAPPQPQEAPAVSTIAQAIERVSRLAMVTFSGDGAAAARAAIEAAAGDRLRDHAAQGAGDGGWTISPAPPGLARGIARLAYLKYKLGEERCGDELKACYVRPAEAEIKLSLGLLGSKIKRSLRPQGQ